MSYNSKYDGATVEALLDVVAAGDDVYEFIYSDGTATAEMVTGLASAIADNKLIISGGVTYKHYATQDGMIILISAPAYNIETAAFDVQLLGVNTSTNEVMTESTSVSIPSAVTESTVAGWGFTKNTGTITGIKMNGASKGTSGVVDLGTVITDISGKQDVLVSGTNIKTVNGESLLGEGNIEIESGGATPRVEMTDATAELEPNKFYIWDNMPESLDLTLADGDAGVMNRYLFQFRNPKDAVTLLTLPDDITWSEDTELDENGMPVMEATAFYRIEIIEGLASLKKWKLAYIVFADAEVESVLMSKGIGDGIGITKKDAKEVTNIGDWFKVNTAITSFEELQFFENITYIVGYDSFSTAQLYAAFYGCSNLENIKFPPYLQEVGGGAFAGATALKIDIDIPNLAKIGNNAFRMAGIVRVLNLGNVNALGTYGTHQWGGEGVFLGCSNLRVAILSASLESIPAATFYQCSALEAVICKAVTPPAIGGAYCFASTNNCPLYVPDSSVEAYKGASEWNSYASRIKAISDLATDNPTLYAEIEQYL